MTVRFRDEALQDLEDIAGFIAGDNPAAAFAVVARIHSVSYETLEILPHSGHAWY
jgi:plasmid stabilization system protein ParE